MATPDGPLIFDFPTPRPIGSPGPISGLGLSPLEKSALAVVKVLGCAEAGAGECDASEGTGAVIHPRGLILTALHAVVEDPDDLRSSLLPEISIGVVTDVDAFSAEPTYRASVAAIDPDLDIALLWIIQPADQPPLDLPTLPVERIGNREFRNLLLQVMGFPQGESSLKEPDVGYYGVKDGAVEVQAPLVGYGFSGSPLLVAREGRHHIGGVVFYRSDGPVLVQPVRRLNGFRWDAASPRLWAEDAQPVSTNAGALPGLNLTVNVHAVDLAGRELQLLAVAYDTQNQPWPSADEQLTLRRTFEPARFLDVIPLRLSKPLAGLGRVPERLRFVLQLWDMEQSELLWEETVNYLHSPESPTATSAPTIAPTMTPTGTPTSTKSAITTTMSTKTPTNPLIPPTSTLTPTTMPMPLAGTNREFGETLGGTVAFTETAPITDTVIFVDIETTIPFTETLIFTGTFSFTETVPFIKTGIFTGTVPFTETVPITETVPFTGTVSFTLTVPFTETVPLTETVIFIEIETVPFTEIVDRVRTMREFGGIPFVYVPAGEFNMGSNDGFDDEKPVHRVFLDSYWIMQTEVTNAQYIKCVDAGDCRKPNNDHWKDGDYSDHPVTHVSWADAVNYAEWMSDRSGRILRLPTEAEWEKAARGVDGRMYPWGDASPDSNLLNYNRNEGDTTPVGSYSEGVSPYGALDMAGNVLEWTADWYEGNYYASSPYHNPHGPESGSLRVGRGGAWINTSVVVRVSDRRRNFPDVRLALLGFRLASPEF